MALETDYEILFWIIWLLLTFIGQIVLMNFIIAKVGDSYSSCMDLKDEQTAWVRLEMIVERESFFKEEDFENTEWFPKYIIYGVDPLESKETDLLAELHKQLNEFKAEQHIANNDSKKLSEDIAKKLSDDLKEEVKNQKDEIAKKLIEEIAKKQSDEPKNISVDTTKIIEELQGVKK